MLILASSRISLTSDLFLRSCRMSLGFRGFESPYWICATFSTLGAIVSFFLLPFNIAGANLSASQVAAVACVVQVQRIRTQVATLQTLTSHNSSLLSSSSTAPFRPAHQKSDSESSTTPMLSKELNQEPAPMQQTYKRVVLVLSALAASGLTYATLCLVGDYAVVSRLGARRCLHPLRVHANEISLPQSHSPIFAMSSSSRLHLYLYLYAPPPSLGVALTARLG